MQWLIDIIAQRVIDTIGIPPCYIDRGDPAAQDFSIADFILGDGWHELDLSVIVPAGAKAVLLRQSFSTSTAQEAAMLRTAGNVNMFNTSFHLTQMASDVIGDDVTVALSDDRKIEYRLSVNTTSFYLTVRGWWL